MTRVWGWFNELSAARGEGFSGPAGVGYGDILAWTQLTGADPSPTEVSIIIAMDRAWRAEIRRLFDLKTPQK